MAESKPRIREFGGENYAWWKIQITDYMYAKDLDSALEDPPAEPSVLVGADGKEIDGAVRAAEAAKAWKRIDRKALGQIRMAVSPEVGARIADATTTREAMAILNNIYEKPSTNNQVYLLKTLVNMKFAERGGSMLEHVNRFSQAANQLGAAGLRLEAKLEAVLFLCSLPDSYATAVQGIANAAGDSITLKEVVALVMDEEMRRRARGGDVATSSTPAAALTVQNRGMSKSKDRSKGRRRSKSKENDAAAKPFECWTCGDKNHRQN